MLRPAVRLLTVMSLLMPILSGGVDDNYYFSARRKALMEKIPGSVAVIQGAVEPRAYVPFRQNNDFYYLTGVESPGAFLLIDSARHRSILFLPPRNASLEQWEGPSLVAGEEAQASTGIEEVMDVPRLESELQSRKDRSVYINRAPEETSETSRDRASQYELEREHSPWDGGVSRGKAFETSLRSKLGETVSFNDLSPILDSMRLIKDEQEIWRIRQASRIGAAGMKEAIRGTRPGRYEYQIASAATFVFRWNGASGPAYFPIVGSGPNSCYLHYHANTRRMKTGDIVVMDYAPEYRYYDTDITRTFPVSGKFSEEQAQLYGVVLEAQQGAIQKVRPGSTFVELNNAAREIVAHYGYAKYWQHGLSHFVGMSVHDVGNADTLQPGMVITIEPGLYIREKNLGVRIEDTVLVTREGCEILTGDIPKEIRGIEKLMAEKGVTPPKTR
jgi:Xaa-Pro aminopeptidase